MKDRFLSTQELGSLLGLTRQTVRNWIKKGNIKAFHIGQNLKIPIDEAKRLLTYYGLPVPNWLKEETWPSQDSKPGELQNAPPPFTPIPSHNTPTGRGNNAVKWPQETPSGS